MADSERNSNGLASLTEQERRIATAISEGLSNKAVARELTISIKTVEFHLGNVYRKLGVSSRSELAALLNRAETPLPRAPLGTRIPPSAQLVGRDEDHERLTHMLETSTLVTLTGPGGVGKSTLAATVARGCQERFADGVWWVDLAPLPSGADVADTVAAALNIRVSGSLAAIDALAGAVAPCRMLVVLDNCEHVLSSSREVCVRLRQQCRDVVVLATSRRRLDLAWEQDTAVQPLPTNGAESAAVALLRSRLRPDLAASPTGDDDTLIEICRLVDGLPLAIELAAGRCRSMPVADVAQRLGDRFPLLGGRTDGRSTLYGTMTWSFDLLGLHARRVLSRLSVFAGRFTSPAAVAVAALGDLTADDVEEGVRELVELSLIDFDGTAYRLLQTTRDFARERLVAAGDEALAVEAHLSWAVDLAARARNGLRTADEAVWVGVLDVAWPDIRAGFESALNRKDPTSTIELATTMAIEGFFRRPDVCHLILEGVRRFSGTLHPRMHELVAAGGLAAWVIGDPARSRELGLRSLAMDPTPGTALDCLPQMAAAYGLLWTGGAERGVSLLREMLPFVQGDEWLRGYVLANIPIGCLFVNRFSEGREAAAEATLIASRLNNPTLAVCAVMAATIGVEPDEFATTLAEVRRGIAAARAVSNAWFELALEDTASLMALDIETTDLTTQLAAAIVRARRHHRDGWTLHAWSDIGTLALILSELGRLRTSALMLLACQRSPAAADGEWLKRPLHDHLVDELGAETMTALDSEAARLDLLALLDLAEAEL